MLRSKRYAGIMAHPLAYRLWQAPFAERKLAPLRTRGELQRARRVLDVGCGPGTNTPHFAHAEYLGIDINEHYVEEARRRHGREFVAADVTTYRVARGERFDFIFLNSLLHHLPTAEARALLAHLATLLTDDGHVHILDLVLPPERSISRLLALADRGDHPRPLADWRAMFEASFEPEVMQPYALGAAGLTLWSMVYFKGRARG